MKHTIFAGTRKRLRVPAYVNVCLVNYYWKKNVRDHFVYWSREERDVLRPHKVLYRINVYPKGGNNASLDQ